MISISSVNTAVWVARILPGLTAQPIAAFILYNDGHNGCG